MEALLAYADVLAVLELKPWRASPVTRLIQRARGDDGPSVHLLVVQWLG